MGTSMAHALENDISCLETQTYLNFKKHIYKNIFSDVSDIKGV